MCYLKCILRCCTEFFFWIFDFRVSFSELENWDFKEKNWKKKLKFFCSNSSFTKNKSFLRQILRQPWNFFSKKVIFECFWKRKHQKIQKNHKGPPLWKKWFKKKFLAFFAYFSMISYMNSRTGYEDNTIHHPKKNSPKSLKKIYKGGPLWFFWIF